MNLNSTVRNFNFSHNDLSSFAFEFSVKVAAIISRHPVLVHLNIANTNLKREEVLFIGLSLSLSQTLQCLHLASSTLPYYERIFLRAIISARVNHRFRPRGNKRAICNNMEKNLLLEMAPGNLQDKSMMEYVKVFKELDERRQGLDFEIQDLLKEVDTQASYADHDPETTNLESFAPDSKIALLISKIIERKKEIEE